MNRATRLLSRARLILNAADRLAAAEFLAEDQHGRPVSPTSPAASRYSLMGAVLRADEAHARPQASRAGHAALRAVERTLSLLDDTTAHAIADGDAALGRHVISLALAELERRPLHQSPAAQYDLEAAIAGAALNR